MITSAYLDDLQIHGASTYGLTQMTIGSPAPREVAENKPSDHGVNDVTAYYGPRLIDLVGYVQATDMASLWAAVDNLKGKLRLGTSHTFKFRRSGLSFDEQATVRVSNSVDILLDQTMVQPIVKWGVTLNAPDPRIYETTLSQGSYDPTSGGSGGLVFPLTYPLVFGAAGTAPLSLNVDNNGNIDSPPTFTISGPVTNPAITNQSNSNQTIYTTSCTMSTGQSLVIDVAAKTVTLDGTSRPDLIDASLTDWFNLVPGSNALKMTGSGMATGSTLLSVSFRSARI